MSRSGIRRKHTADAIQLCRISHPASHPYKEGPHVRVNGGAKEDALVDKDKDPRVSHLAKDRIKRLTGGASRPLGSAAPSCDPVQVHFGEEYLPRHLITFHMCVGGKPTSRAINLPLLHPSKHTHTHTHTHTNTQHTHTHTLHSILSKKALLSLALLAR